LKTALTTSTSLRPPHKIIASTFASFSNKMV
jgi:hypothetical protein